MIQIMYTPKDNYNEDYCITTYTTLRRSEPRTRSREDEGEQSGNVIRLHVRPDDVAGVFREALDLRVRQLSRVRHKQQDDTDLSPLCVGSGRRCNGVSQVQLVLGDRLERFERVEGAMKCE